MQQIDQFEERLRQISALMIKGKSRDAEPILKQLQKDLKYYLVGNKIVVNDRLAEIQIAVYNNLACIFESKGKYKSSLFHLQIAEKLQTAYFKHKYGQSEATPPSALEQLATTYSNLSAIHQKLMQHQQAFNCIQFAVQLMQKHKDLEKSAGIVHLYYNYAILLECSSRYQQASRFAIAGKSAAENHRNDQMVRKYIQLLEKIKQHLAKQEIRKHRTLKKYLVGETGIVKPIDSIDVGRGSSITEEDKQKMKEFVNQHMARDHSSAEKPRTKSFFGSKTTTPSKSYHLSYYRKSNHRSLSSNISARVGKIKSNNLRSYNSSSNSAHKDTSIGGLIQAYGVGGRLPKGVTIQNDHFTVDSRVIDRKKRKIQFQDSKMEQKNEVLQQIIEKLYMNSHRQK